MAKTVVETKEQKLRRQREEKYEATMGRSARHFRGGVGKKTPIGPEVAERGSVPSGSGDDAGADKAAIDRVTFSAPAEERWPARLEEYRKGHGLRSTSEAIRALLAGALK